MWNVRKTLRGWSLSLLKFKRKFTNSTTSGKWCALCDCYSWICHIDYNWIRTLLPFFSSFSVLVKSGNVVRPGKSRECDILQPSSSELSEEVPLLALSDLPRAPLLSANEVSPDGSDSVKDPPDDCCLRLRYSDIDNYEHSNVFAWHSYNVFVTGAKVISNESKNRLTETGEIVRFYTTMHA